MVITCLSQIILVGREECNQSGYKFIYSSLSYVIRSSRSSLASGRYLFLHLLLYMLQAAENHIRIRGTLQNLTFWSTLKTMINITNHFLTLLLYQINISDMRPQPSMGSYHILTLWCSQSSHFYTFLCLLLSLLWYDSIITKASLHYWCCRDVSPQFLSGAPWVRITPNHWDRKRSVNY